MWHPRAFARSGRHTSAVCPRSTASGIVIVMDKDSESQESSSHLARWLTLIALGIIAAVVGRQIAVNAADREFEARLAELDANRDTA